MAALPTWNENGWIIDKMPNSIAAEFTYVVTAVDAEGYCIVRHDFQTKRAASDFAKIATLAHLAIVKKGI